MSSVFLCDATSYECLLNNGLREHFFVVELHFEIRCTSLGRRAPAVSVLGFQVRKSGISFRMKAFYSDRFVLPLPAGHRFPLQKYYLLRERVQAELPEVKLDEAPVAADSELARIHAADYIERVATGALDAHEQREIG